MFGISWVLGEGSTDFLSKQPENVGPIWPQPPSVDEDEERIGQGPCPRAGVAGAPEQALCPNVPHLNVFSPALCPN